MEMPNLRKTVQIRGNMRFYTYPPNGVEWDWVLRNIKQNPLPCNHEIIDIGIYDLLKPPYQHSQDKLDKWSSIECDGWKVVPDCPDIQGEFKQEVDYDNVEYSWELLTQYFNPEDEHHLPVIQSHYQNLNSFQQYIKQFKELYGEHDKIAIGSICKADDNRIAVKMLKIARREFPDSWIHAFGLRFKQFFKARHLIDSYDSMAWTFPRGSGRGSCKNQAERIQFFQDYINRLEEVMMPYNNEQARLKF